MNGQFHALFHYGYAPTDLSLRTYMIDYDGLIRNKNSGTEELINLNRERIVATAKDAFGIDLEKEPLPVEIARQLATNVHSEALKDSFMKKIDEEMVRLGNEIDSFNFSHVIIIHFRRNCPKPLMMWPNRRRLWQR